MAKFHIRLEAVVEYGDTLEAVRQLTIEDLAFLVGSAGVLPGEHSTISVTDADDWTTRAYGPRRVITTPAYEYNGKAPVMQPYGKSIVEDNYPSIYGSVVVETDPAELERRATRARTQLDVDAMHVPNS